MDQRPLKIAFIIPYFYPAWQYGGQPRAAYDLARGLVRRGHDVRVITTDSAGRSRLDPLAVGAVSDRGFFASRVDGIEVFYYKNLSNGLAYRQRLCLPLGLRADIHRQLQDRDIIHIHELRSTPSVIGSSAAKALKKPYVLSGHGGLRRLGRRSVKTVFDAVWGKRILEEASAIVAVSPVEEQDAHDIGVEECRIHKLPNAIDIDEYKDLPSRRPRPRPLILFLGRLHHIKGVDILIEAFGLARERSLEADLLIAGPDDGEETNLRALVRKRGLESYVTFAGYLDRQAKLQAFVDSTVTVIPSRSEVFALTALESLMCGTPVILSSACGLFPMPGPDEGVTRFKTGDISELADMLLCDHQKSIFESWVRQHFAVNRIAEQAEWLYRQLIL